MQLTMRHMKSSLPAIKGLMSSALIAFMLFYLLFHALNGNHGVYAWFKESKREDSIGQTLEELRAKRATLEHRVSLISNETLDLDLLEEQARKQLGFAGRGEVIYLMPDEPAAATIN